MTLDQIKDAAGVKSISTYMTHEDNPSAFRLGEISGIYHAMDEPAKSLLREAVCEIFLPE
ncbi:MAG: hypothetical protein HFJ72_08590 [Adlercreutzia sp.]|nr:hypothetical protein [Adlercreutzia sp.]